jgi:hypothetical protein
MQDEKVALIAEHVPYRFAGLENAISVPFPVIAGPPFANLDVRGFRFSDLTCMISLSETY